MNRVYLDYNASTPLGDAARRAMIEVVDEVGNAASDHWAGVAARDRVEHARGQIAALVGARPSEVVFTSGATEADNLVLLGALASSPDDAELVVSAVEHPAVLEAARQWGSRCSVADVGTDGRLDPERLARALTPRTALVSVMTANNETGALQPMAAIAQVCAEHGVPLHTDAAQAAARVPLADAVKPATAISLSGHKMYGPQGVGALVIRRARPRLRLRPRQVGGGHERGLRSGSLPTALIAGFGAAADELLSTRTARSAVEAQLRERLLEGLRDRLPDIELNTPVDHSIAQTLNVRIPGVNAQALLRLVSRELAISTGSACSSASVEPSPVLLAQGLTPTEAGESVRLSFGNGTTAEDIDCAVAAIGQAARRLRSVSLAASA